MKEKEKNILKIILYVGFLFILIIVSKLVSNQSTNNENNTNKIYNNKLKEFSNYESQVHLVLDGDAVTLKYEKIRNAEMGSRIYHNDTKNYLRYNNCYYEVNGTEFTKLDEFSRLIYDDTFIDINNIIKILDLKEINSSNEYDLKDILNIYNEVNSTSYFDINNKKITLDYKEDGAVISIILDLTNLYNLVNKKEESSVIYNLSFKEISDRDISFIEDKIN